jgi:segregation and condensation protein B
MTPVRDIKIIEAILFASGDPVLESDLKEKVINKNQFDDYMKEIQKFYEFRGINIIKNGLKWSFRTSIDIADDLIIFKQQKRKISRAALETLAIVAYYQPVTRSEIENIRGVQMGRGSIDHLMEIGWIKPGLRKNVPGKPSLWSTTDLFLEHFGLENIQNLPNKDELKANGFLEKRSAIASITDLALNNSESIEAIEDQEAENLDDFLPIND